jgi:hypothetical protein
VGFGMVGLGLVINFFYNSVDCKFFDKVIRPNFELLTFYNFESNFVHKYLIKDEIIKQFPEGKKTLEGFLDD